MARIMHAINQFPWRSRRQAYAIALIGILVVSLVAAAYLALAAKADILARQTMNLREKVADTERMNATMETELASLLSVEDLELRARGLGYRQAGPDEIRYVAVAGYRQPEFQLARLESGGGAAADASLPSEYTMSLLDWFNAQMRGSPGASR